MSADNIVLVATLGVMLSVVVLVLYLAVKAVRAPRRVLENMYPADDAEQMCSEERWRLIKPRVDTILGVQTRSYQDGPVGVWISKLYPDSKRGTHARAGDAVEGSHLRDGREETFYAVECMTRTGLWLLVGAQASDRDADVTVTRETGADRAANVATNRDILFENEDFNRAYTVVSPDAGRAYAVLTLRNIEAITAARPSAVMWHDGWVVFAKRGRLNRSTVREILDVIVTLDK